MDTFLQKIRGKSEKTKKVIIWGTSSAITLVIFIFWILSFQYQKTDMVETAAVGSSPWQQVKESTMKMYDNVKGQIGKLKGSTTYEVKQ